MGYICVCQKIGKVSHFWAPLAYGKDGDISPRSLLIRSRVTMFKTEQEAIQAVEKTLEAEKDNPWINSHRITLMEVDIHET